jgi:membrane protein DedA with SNARE-associated domain
MLHWLHSLLPHIPHYGYVLVFIVAFLNNLGVPLPGETILLGAGFVLGKTADSLWQPVAAGTAACFLGGICAFWLGRRLGRGGLEKIHCLHLTPKRLKWPERFFKRHGAKTVSSRGSFFYFRPSWSICWPACRKCPGAFFFFTTSRGRRPIPPLTS